MTARARLPAALAVVALSALLAPASAAAYPQPARRIAVVVGANEAPSGRTTLRYAHADARAFAATLVDVAGFAPADVLVQLDPSPEAVLRELDAALAGLSGQPEALLVFYFSGHSDLAALYPGGRTLPLSELKARLEDPRASVRVGILDACSGGAWTGAKGIHPAEPFVVDVPFTLGAEGSALVASSSGAESAHEFERIGGSFFTHHLVAGLRGGAERDGDGVVTLGEAFEYAKAGTLRDSAIYAPSPQHPSFVMNLRGRSDLPLARLDEGVTRVDLVQREGPLEVIRLDQALVILELPPGERHSTLVLPPGKYVIRRRTEGETFAAEVQVVAGRAVEIREEALVLFGKPTGDTKGGPSAPAMLSSTLPAGRWEVGIEGGMVPLQDSEGSGVERMIRPRLAVGLGERWQLSILMPQLAYRFGGNATEVIVFGGLAGMDFGGDDTVEPSPEAGVALLQSLPNGHQLLVGLNAMARSRLGEAAGAEFLERRVSATIGWSKSFGSNWTLSPTFGAAAQERPGKDEPAALFYFGSGTTLAGRSRPLLRFHFVPDWSLDGNAGLAWDATSDEWTALYSVGTTWTF